jgi:integrase/recombinase XerD
LKAYLDPRDVDLIEDVASNVRDRLLIRLLFRSGSRVSEAIGLTVDDVDPSSSTITIQHLKARMRVSCPSCKAALARMHAFCPKCGREVTGTTSEVVERRRRRVIPVDPETVSLLGSYIEKGGPVARNGRLLLFPINRHRAWQIVRECAERAGLPKLTNPETGRTRGISPHRLRDAFAVNAVKHDDSGDGLRLLQEHLGHQSFNTTARYRKVSGEEQREWYQNLWHERKS